MDRFAKRFVVIEGIIINYLDLNPEGKYLVFFLHGNSQSANAWRKQITDGQFADFRLIVFDLPGHRGSDLPPADRCTLPGIASIMSKAVKALSNDSPYVLVAVSLATNIVAEMLSFDIVPEGIVLAGPSIVGNGITVDKIIKPHTHVGVVFMDHAEEEDLQAYARETSFSTDEEDVRLFIEDYKNVKTPFRSLLAKSIGENCYSDEIALLKASNLPLLLVFGADEAVVNTNYLDNISLALWNESIYKISGASHLVNIDEPEAFNHLLANYVTERLNDTVS